MQNAGNWSDDIGAESASAATSLYVHLFVICPVRREHTLGLYSAARKSLAEAGLPPSGVRRMQGIDLLAGRKRNRGRTARAVVRASVLRDFIPKALACLRKKKPQVRYVLVAADDCRMFPGIRLPQLLAVARKGGARAAWLGYRFRHGEPVVGAHLVRFSRSSLMRFRAYAKEADPRGRLAF